MIKLAQVLKKEMKAKGLTQGDLAKLLNTTQQNISLYCTAKGEPNIATLRKLCEVLNITPNDLLDFHEFDIR